MAMWTDLPRAFAGSGLPVVEYGGWKGRGHGTPGTALCVVCHHTAGPATGNTPSLNVCVNGRPGLPGPLCNLYLARDGTVYIIAAGIAYHAGATNASWANNSHALGIEAEATGVSSWPEPQYSNFAKMCRCLSDFYRFPIEKIVGHKEICSPAGRKIDPNFDMAAFRRLCATGAPVVPPPPPPPVDFPDDEENQMLIIFDTAGGKNNFHGQRTCEAGGNVAKEAWASFSTAWGDCHVIISALDGKGGAKFMFGEKGKPGVVLNNRQIGMKLPEGTRIVTIEGTRANPGTVPACDIYNIR
jgi:hypothetical protein